MIPLILSGSTRLPEKVRWFPCIAQALVNRKFTLCPLLFIYLFIYFGEEVAFLSLFLLSTLRTLTAFWSMVSVAPESHWNVLVICAPQSPPFPHLLSLGGWAYAYTALFSSPRSGFMPVGLEARWKAIKAPREESIVIYVRVYMYHKWQTHFHAS